MKGPNGCHRGDCVRVAHADDVHQRKDGRLFAEAPACKRVKQNDPPIGGYNTAREQARRVRQRDARAAARARAEVWA